MQAIDPNKISFQLVDTTKTAGGLDLHRTSTMELTKEGSDDYQDDQVLPPPRRQLSRSFGALSTMSIQTNFHSVSENLTVWPFLWSFAQLSVFIFTLSALLVFLSEYYLDRSAFIDYANTIVMVVLVFRILSQKFIEEVMKSNSVIFNDMDTLYQQKACAHFGTAIWLLFWIPIAIQLAWHIYENIESNQQIFFEKWGSYAVVILRMGMLDQLIELVLRQMDLSLHVHHYGEIIFSLIFLDFVPVSEKSPGLYVFCLLSAFDRISHPLFSLSSLAKQRDKYISMRRDEENDFIYTPCGFDLLLPSNHTLATLYWVCFWYYVVFLRIAVTALVCVFCTYQWRYLSLIWKVLYPLMNVLFILVDVNVYLIFWKRSKTPRK